MQFDLNTLPKSRPEAKKLGAKHYFTNKPCKRGHIVPRETKGTCTQCRVEDAARDYEKRAVYFAEFNKTDRAKANKRRYYEKNRALIIAKAASQPKDRRSAARKKHKAENPELYRAHTNARRKRFKEATPPWLTKDQKKQIRGLYLQAQQISKVTGQQYEVDHIIPLLGENVSGLHVPWNLQVILANENRIKNNKIA